MGRSRDSTRRGGVAHILMLRPAKNGGWSHELGKSDEYRRTSRPARPAWSDRATRRYRPSRCRGSSWPGGTSRAYGARRCDTSCVPDGDAFGHVHEYGRVHQRAKCRRACRAGLADAESGAPSRIRAGKLRVPDVYGPLGRKFLRPGTVRGYVATVENIRTEIALAHRSDWGLVA